MEADTDPTPTATWVNFYGPAFLTDTLPLPSGSRILALDPDGVVCGAITVTVAGQYGLLPCYGDDPTTPDMDEGAVTGDSIRFLIDGVTAARQPLSFNGLPISGTQTATWTAHGDRWEVALQPRPIEFSYSVYLPLISKNYEEDVYREDFEGVAGPEWSRPITDTTPSGRTFLGQFGAEDVNLTLTDLPAHSQVTVAFDLYVIRSWDGNETEVPVGSEAMVDPDASGNIGPDIWELAVAGGEALLHTTFSNWDALRQAYPDDYPLGDYPSRTGAAENNSLGYEFGSPRDAVYRLRFTFDHTDDDLALDFAALGLQAIDDESWGLDNVRVTLH